MNYVKIEGDAFIIDMMYARTDNMVCRAVYQDVGWGNLAVVHQDVWHMLQKTVPVLKKYHLKMKICDAYRLPYAHELLKQAVPMEGFFAADATRSQHCHGTAIDVCLCDENGKELAYPTAVDAYEVGFAKAVAQGEIDAFLAHLQKARHDYMGASVEEIENREFLKNLMEDVGFLHLPHEWWHYNLPNGKDNEKYPMLILDPQTF